MRVTRSALIFSLWLTSITAVAQFRLPQIDIEAKGGFAKIDAGENELIDDANYIPVQGGLHIQINQHIAVGGFYSRTLKGAVKYGTDEFSRSYDLESMNYGVDVRFSSGRSVKWRPYLGLVYGKMEMVQKTNDFNLAGESTMLGLNAGVMLRFGRNFYWTIVEVSPRYLSDKFFFLQTDFLIEAKTGFLYNIRFKSK